MPGVWRDVPSTGGSSDIFERFNFEGSLLPIK